MRQIRQEVKKVKGTDYTFMLNEYLVDRDNRINGKRTKSIKIIITTDKIITSYAPKQKSFNIVMETFFIDNKSLISFNEKIEDYMNNVFNETLSVFDEQKVKTLATMKNFIINAVFYEKEDGKLGRTIYVKNKLTSRLETLDEFKENRAKIKKYKKNM